MTSDESEVTSKHAGMENLPGRAPSEPVGLVQRTVVVQKTRHGEPQLLPKCFGPLRTRERHEPRFRSHLVKVLLPVLHLQRMLTAGYSI